MAAGTLNRSRILIVEGAQETRDSIKALLNHDGYCVDQARDEEEAVEKIRLKSPDLILISLGGTPECVLSAAERIRYRGGVGHEIPVVIFSLAILPEGTEEEIAGNIHITAPDNFNQLRRLLTRVRAASRTH
jgi:DNA-binding response OmpR family regulator